MTLESAERARFDGNAVLQQIHHHFAHGIDLIGIGMRQHLLTFVPIGFLENTFQERTFST